MTETIPTPHPLSLTFLGCLAVAGYTLTPVHEEGGRSDPVDEGEVEENLLELFVQDRHGRSVTSERGGAS